MTPARIAAPFLACLLMAAGCGESMVVLDPAGPQAQRIAGSSWVLFVAGGLVFVTVIVFLAIALRRGSQRAESVMGADVDRHLARWTIGAVLITALILVALLLMDFGVGRALATFADDDALRIRIVGHQWWWEVVYEAPEPHRHLTTANEIYIPVGRRIRIEAESRDVIHSFWAPNLHGKVDLIPGYRTTTFLRADRAGIFQGRCAEFCGLQHAKMGFRVIAVPSAEFEAWYERQLQPAIAPTDALTARGEEVFLTSTCVLCHTIRGTPAGSRVGPDLTHIASRSTLGAAALENNRGNLAGWILDPQRIKPGARMPPTQLESPDLLALVAYLESLR